MQRAEARGAGGRCVGLQQGGRFSVRCVDTPWALANPARPLVAIVGGSKVSGKLQVLEALIEKADQIIVGGGIANTFLAAATHRIGKSLYEVELVDNAKALIRVVDELCVRRCGRDGRAHGGRGCR